MSAGSFVLVGYDAGADSDRALGWAAEEARMREVPLMVCHAWRWPYPDTYVDLDGRAIIRRQGEELLEYGAQRAREIAPDILVNKRLLEGPPYAALQRLSANAALTVLGSHSPDELPAGSTAMRLPVGASRPVLVVRTEGGRHRRVLVGFDGSAPAEAAMAFGFEEAALRGWRLQVVHGCWEPGEADFDDLPMYADRDRLRHVQGARLEHAAAPWLERYPQVEAQVSLELEAPRAALFEAAESADLLVVGNRGLHSADPHRMGLISGSVLQHARCTVAIVQASPSGRETERN